MSPALCVPLSSPLPDPTPGPLPDPSLPGRVGEAAFEKSGFREGRGRGGETHHNYSHGRVMGVEEDPGGERNGSRRARQSRALAGPNAQGARGSWARSELLRRLAKRTSAELSLVQPPQLAFVVLRYWQGRSDGEECVLLHVSLVGYNGANRILLSRFPSRSDESGVFQSLTYYIIFNTCFYSKN